MEKEVSDASTQRKSTRIRTPSRKKTEYSSIKENAVDHFVDLFSDDESSVDNEENVPKVLHEHNSVPGDRIFPFNSRRRRTGILQKAKMERMAFYRNTSGDDPNLSSSGSDFSPSASDYASGEDAESSQSDTENSPQNLPMLHLDSNTTQRKKFTQNYSLQAEQYFENHATKKVVTSNHTLDELQTPRLPQAQLHELITKVKISNNHQKAVGKLMEENRKCFPKWLYYLHENFSIALYGLGSKKQLLDQFHREMIYKQPVIVINGFFPSLSAKEILDAVLEDAMGMDKTPANPFECCDYIESQLQRVPHCRVYVLVHNIEMIRCRKAQMILSRIASIKNIHLIASVDHINAPLIWDYSKLSKYRFTWWDVTSFCHYNVETSFDASLMTQQSGALALSSLRNVFQSLTSNSKGIYQILIKHELDNKDNALYQGLAFKDLYAECREAFLVSSDLALRAQLTEFSDHKMIKFKRGGDGSETLVIPIQHNILQQFLQEQSYS